MIDFLNKLFGRQPSGATAKERLRLVLMSDHLSLAPEMIEAMKRDFVDVISRYVEVDRTRIDVTFEQQDKTLAMLANIPITGVARASDNGYVHTNGTSSNGTSPDEALSNEPHTDASSNGLLSAQKDALAGGNGFTPTAREASALTVTDATDASPEIAHAQREEQGLANDVPTTEESMVAQGAVRVKDPFVTKRKTRRKRKRPAAS